MPDSLPSSDILQTQGFATWFAAIFVVAMLGMFGLLVRHMMARNDKLQDRMEERDTQASLRIKELEVWQKDALLEFVKSQAALNEKAIRAMSEMEDALKTMTATLSEAVHTIRDLVNEMNRESRSHQRGEK